jgi:hypothetical protein
MWWMIMSLLQLGVVRTRTTPSGLLHYLLKRIYLTLPTLDLALFTTNLLTDNISRRLRLVVPRPQLPPGPATKVHQQVPQVFYSLRFRAQPDPRPGDLH